MPDFDVPKVRDAAAREMDANFNPDKHPILAAMFSDYSQTAMSVIVPAVTQQIRALHHPYTVTGLGDYCQDCGTKWPCKTERELQKLDAAVRADS